MTVDAPTRQHEGPTRATRLMRSIEPHRGGRFAALDGVRAIAAGGVVVYHVAGYAQLTGDDTALSRFLNNLGNFGVATFFLLSGFLLYRPFAAAWFRGEPPPDPVRYLRHRFLRIFPGYWLALSVFIAFGLLQNKNPSGDFYFTLYALLQDQRRGFGVVGLTVAWTLSIEIVFYLALPFLAAAFRLIGRRARNTRMRLEAQLVGLATMYAIALIYRVLVAVPAQYDKGSVAHLWLPNYFDWFALGMFLAVLLSWGDLGNELPGAVQRFANTGWACVLVSISCYVVLMMLRDAGSGGAAGFGDKESTAEMVLRFFLNGLAALFLLLPLVLSRREGLGVKRALATMVPAFLGTISYGIYLWHKIWLDRIKVDHSGGSRLGFWVMFGLVSALTVVSAAASYYLLERPIMRFKDPRAARRARRTAPSSA